MRPAGRASTPRAHAESHQSARSPPGQRRASARGIKRRAVWDKRGKPRKEQRARGSGHPRAAVVCGPVVAAAPVQEPSASRNPHLGFHSAISHLGSGAGASSRPARFVACASSHLLATSLLMMVEGEVFLCWFKKLRIGVSLPERVLTGLGSICD